MSERSELVVKREFKEYFVFDSNMRDIELSLIVVTKLHCNNLKRTKLIQLKPTRRRLYGTQKLLNVLHDQCVVISLFGSTTLQLQYNALEIVH